jgi:hypothetical protein
MAFFGRGKRQNRSEPLETSPGVSAREEEDTPTDTFVMFSVPASKLSGMDVATGPCVPIPGRKHALCSVHSQEGPERLDQMLALFTLLGGREGERTDAMQLLEARGPGRLYLCSERFVQLMADENHHQIHLADEDKAAGDKELTRFVAELRRLDVLWMATGGWHKRQVSTRNKLTARIPYARWAQEKGQPVYCWYGPATPEYVIVQSQGPYAGSGH